MGNKPFAVLSKSKPGAQNDAGDQDKHDEDVGRAASKLAADKAAREARVDKVTALLFGAENPIDIIHGKMFPWFTREAETGQEVAMHVSDFYDVDRNRHLKDLTHSIAVDRFADCYSNADAERRHQVALRKKILNAHGIRYVVLHRGEGGSLLDAPVQLLSQDV